MKTPARHYRASIEFRCFPDLKQERILDEFLETARGLWNDILYKLKTSPTYLDYWPENDRNLDPIERAWCPITCYDLFNELTKIRRTDPKIGQMPRAISEGIIENITNAQKAQRATKKKGRKTGSLRYKRYGEVKSLRILKFVQKGQKFKLRNISGKYGHFTIKNIPGSIKIKMTCKIPENAEHIDATLVKNYKGQWHLRILCRFETPKPMKIKKYLGADVGLRKLATLSDGTEYENQKSYLEDEQKEALLCRRLSRKYVKGQPPSKNYQRAKIELRNFRSKRARRRRHHIDHEIVNPVLKKCIALKMGLALEDLNIAGMSRKKGHLGKSFHNAALGILIKRLHDKFESLGIPVISVNPQNTSKMCSSCNEMVPKSRGTTIHSCPHCGLELDRDHNAAINISNRAEHGPLGGDQQVNGSSSRKRDSCNLLSTAGQVPKLFTRSNKNGGSVIQQETV